MKTASRFAAKFGKQLGLTTAICLIAIACGGSGASESVSAAATQQPGATPVPTTAPLSLPPADVGLPELAPLPASVSATGPGNDGPANDAVEPGASAADSAASAGEVTVAPIEQVPNASTAVTIASADRWSDCVLLAAETTQSAALLDPIAVGTTTDLSSVQLNSLAATSVGCDIVTSGLGATDIGDYVPTAASCMNAWLESSGGGSVFAGLASVGWGQSIPGWAQQHFVDAIDSCFSGASFAADVMSVVSADSSLTGAFDAGCLASSFDASGTLRAFAQSLADNPTFATISVSLSDAWVLRCANVGQMVAVAAAADGVSLSAPTISCIDAELKATGAVAGLVAGTADTDAVGIATVACLTDAEAAALLG